MADAPRIPSADSYQTRGGISVRRIVEAIPVEEAIEPVIDGLDSQRGVLLASSYEYPGRYTRWDMGFVNPPLALTSRGRNFSLAALNTRGLVLLPTLASLIETLPAVASAELRKKDIIGTITLAEGRFPEEQRSKQASIFSLLRAIIDLFAHPDEPHLGLYGAFGYDLAFQFEPLKLRLARSKDQRDLVLYIPDELVVIDHQREQAVRYRYDFEVDGHSTQGLPRDGAEAPYVGTNTIDRVCDHEPGEYAEGVRVAREAF